MATRITVTTEPTVDPQTPTPTHYQEAAGQYMAAVDVLIESMPKIEESESTDTKQARRNLGVPDAFCASAVVALEQFPGLDMAKKLDAEKCRNRLQFLEAFGAVEDKLEGALQRVKHARRAVKSALATDALLVYRMVRVQASDDRSPGVAAHGAAMKRDLGRKGLTKAARDQRKAEKLQEEVAKALAAEKEVKKAA